MEDDAFEKLEKLSEKKVEKKSNKFTRKKEDDSTEKSSIEAQQKKVNADKSENAKLEKLDQEEKRVVAQEVINERKEAVSRELASVTPDSVDESVAIAGATFLEIVNEQLARGTDINDAMDQAELDTISIADLEQPSDEPFTLEHDPTYDSLSKPESTHESQSAEDIQPLSRVATKDWDTDVAEIHGVSTTDIGGGPDFIQVQNDAPIQVATVEKSRPVQVPIDTFQTRRAFVTGGVIGYLVGRRRGRIKSEEKLLPIQQTLKKEVTALRSSILQREQKLRILTTEIVQHSPEAPRKIINHIQMLQELKYPERKLQHTEKTSVRSKKPEQVGKIVLGAKEVKTDMPAVDKQPASVESLPLEQLLTVAKRIKIEGSSLRRLYETGRIGEKGLRRVVKQYLRGESYDAVLKQELVSPEESYQSEYSHSSSTNSYVDTTTQSPPRNLLDDSISKPDAIPIPAHNFVSNRTQKSAFITLLVVIVIVFLLFLL